MLQQEACSSERNGIRTIGNGSGSVAHSATSLSVDSMLANELNKLTFRERESINEEIHGVDIDRGSVEETTEMLTKSFRDLDTKINYLCSTNGDVGQMAFAFKRSQQLFGSTPEKGTYLNRNEIRIMFLRCERFNCQKAATRICGYADLMYDLYGDVGLQRLSHLSDLEDEEMAMMKQGRCQLFPGCDRAGRRIYAHFCSDAWDSLIVKSRLRIITYLLTDLMLRDVIGQRRGIVGLFWMPPGKQMGVNDFVTRGKINKRSTACLPVRIGAIHFCFPSIESYRNGPFVHMISGLARQIKPKMRIHSGSPMECIYILESFGITSKHNPFNIATSELDLTNHHRWLKLCIAMEKKNTLQQKIIECPRNSDILLGRGQIIMNHPGNIIFRNIIQSKLQVYSNARCRKDTTDLTWTVVRTLKTEYGARFLKEETIDGNVMTWVEVSNDVARRKVRISFRDTIKRLAKSKEKETTATNSTKSDEGFKPLPLISSPSFSKCDNGEISTVEDNLSLSSPLPDQENNDIAIPDCQFSFSTTQHQQQEQLSAQTMHLENISNRLYTLNENLSDLNSNLNTLLNQQIISDSSTSAFLGLDGSSNSKRQRLCSHNFFDCE